MGVDELFAHTVARVGPLHLTDTVLTAWALTALLGLLAWLLGRGRGLAQVVAEGVVTAAEEAVAAVAPGYVELLVPFILPLWLFLLAANLVGLVPGLDAPTRDLSVTAALAVIVFLAVHWYGIRTLGLRRYLRHYLSPTPLLLPFHIISELTRSIALAVRLFGNMMSLEMVGLLLLLVAGFLVPVPILLLHVIEALVQAYIFGVLALVYIVGALQTQPHETRPAE